MSWYLSMKRRNEQREVEKLHQNEALEERRRKLVALRNAPRSGPTVLPAPPMALQQPLRDVQPTSGGSVLQQPSYPVVRPRKPRTLLRATLASSPRKGSFADRVQLSSTLLGTGAFGAVYLGIHHDSGAMVAVKKVLLSGCPSDESNSQIDEVVQEIRLMKELHHENIVEYYFAERRDGHLWIFLEFMAGGSLASVLKKFEVLSETVMRVYFIQVLEGLRYLHRRNIVHRDVKLENLLLSASGVVKISDFGTSREFSDGRNLLTVAGSPPMMAPEVVCGTGHGTPADVWSVACAMIHLCTGKPPFAQYDNPVTIMFQIAMHPERVHEAYESAALSSALKDVLHACLRVDPSQRPSVDEVLAMPFFAEDTSSGSDGDEAAAAATTAAMTAANSNTAQGMTFVPMRPLQALQPAPLSRGGDIGGRGGRPATPPRSTFSSRLREETQNQHGVSAVSGSVVPPANREN